MRAAIASGLPLPELNQKDVDAVLGHPAATADEYRLARIAEWSQPKYDLDKRFTKLTLLLDQGPQAEGGRWQAQPQSFDDLRDILAAAPDPALVLLGPPGCGKSTLLRRLELDLAADALRAEAPNEAPLSFFLPLNRYRATHENEPAPSPEAWLAAEWAQRYPKLPALADLLPDGRMVLLLDAINEIPHRGEEDYRHSIVRWRAYLADLTRSARGSRVLFSCRSLDYTAALSTPELAVPHVRIERLGDAQVEAFLNHYSPQHGAALWQRLAGTPQLELFRSPFYLKMLLAQLGPKGELPPGRAALFTGFVRQALQREIVADNPLFRRGALLAPPHYDRIIANEWRDAVDLPDEAQVLLALRSFAYQLQARRSPGDASRVRCTRAEAVSLLGGEEALRAGIALQVLETQFADVYYAHQLLQEYFAARALAAAPSFDLATRPWRAHEMRPSLQEVVEGLADSDPLPAAPATGWEETYALAAAMAQEPESFVAELVKVNLPLAGRCAAQPDVPLSEAAREALRGALIVRSRDEGADLRARIAVARSLGELGDPRFERRHGPHGDYLLPPTVPIAGGEYLIGSDEGHYEDEAPIHKVTLAPFVLGKFPVSNAEWRLFMRAGGYEDERWWDTAAARRWREGTGTAEGPKAQWRQNRKYVQANPDWPQLELKAGRMTTNDAQFWEWLRDGSEAEFEAQLDRWYPQGRQTQPRFWNDPAYNHPSQPMVGVCWYEARAYCTWLSAQTRQSFRLPSEAQWEAAARGHPKRKWYRLSATARRYAWGEEFDAARCNTFETHIRGTTPIGVFAGGDTPEGLVDMTGNVWDWTSSLDKPYPYAGADGGEDDEADGPRVLRGGSWYYSRIYCRCASRGHFVPGNRSAAIGFRVCLAPPIK